MWMEEMRPDRRLIHFEGMLPENWGIELLHQQQEQRQQQQQRRLLHAYPPFVGRKSMCLEKLLQLGI